MERTLGACEHNAAGKLVSFARVAAFEVEQHMKSVTVGLLIPLLGGFALECRAHGAADAPPGYMATVRLQQENKFSENAIKSFVYHVFALYDKHADVGRFLPLIADKDLEMKFPDALLGSHQDFERWYAGIGQNIRSNTHSVERMSVQFHANGKYQVDLIVLWQAITKENRFVSFRAHQLWTLDNGTEGKWPRILSYIVEEAPGPAKPAE